MLSAYLTAFGLFLIFLYRQAQRKRIHCNGHPLPKPTDTLPIFGNGLRFLQPRDALFEWFVGCQRYFGLRTYQIAVPGLPQGVVINDPKNLEHVLQNESIFGKGEIFRKRSWDLFGNGIINVDGELWKIQRKAGAQFFTGASIDSLVENELPQHFAKMRRTMLEAASTSSPVDLQALFFDLTTATMGRLAYGMDIDASSAFATLFDYASGKTGERFQNPLYPLTERFTGARFRAAVSEVHKFGKEIVSQAETRLNRVRNGESGISISKPATGSTLIELLLTKLDDRRIVADSALNFLSAARDTTAQALTWTFYCLMRNPHIVLQIRRELGERLQSVSTPQDLTTSLLQPQSLPYLHAVFNEALRLFPPIPFEIKQCMADAMLPDGTFLPKGSVVFWSIWSMNRSKEIWGDYDPVNEYIPERWINNSTANGEEGRTRVFKGRSAFEFPVFNGGPRACLGRKMAELMAVWVIAKMVAEFDFKELSGLKDVAEDRRKTTKMNGDHGGANAKLPPRRTKNSLTLPMEGGLPCLLTELRSH